MSVRARVTVSSGQGVVNKIREIQNRLASNKEVAVGLPASAGTAENGMTFARLGAIHEFGATFMHPGGTKYVIGDDGKARFVSNSYQGDVAGVTGPHQITIPERSFLRVPLRAAQDQIAKSFTKLMPKVVSGELTFEQALNQIGARAASVPQEAISAGIDPPNKASTVRRKGSSTPLMDGGDMRQAITWVIREKGL